MLSASSRRPRLLVALRATLSMITCAQHGVVPRSCVSTCGGARQASTSLPAHLVSTTATSRAFSSGTVATTVIPSVSSANNANAGTGRRSQSSIAGPPGPTFRTSVAIGTALVGHPGKPSGGEDALFSSPESRTIGVADGVGGWATQGIDAGVLSKTLMEECKRVAERDMLREEGTDPLTPLEILRTALARVPHGTPGTTTALVASLHQDDTLRAAWIGDSGLIVVRITAGEPHVIFRSAEQQHYFNCPFQLGAPGGAPGDLPESAEEIELGVVDGDLIIAGSDGLFDNLFDEEILEIVDNGGAEPHRRIAPGAATDGHRSFGANNGDPSPSSSPDSSSSSPFGSTVRAVPDTWRRRSLHGDILGDLDLDKLARRLAERAQERATTIEEVAGEIVPTPFEVSAKAKGIEMVGGKLDDVAIVIARVSRSTQ